MIVMIKKTPKNQNRSTAKTRKVTIGVQFK